MATTEVSSQPLLPTEEKRSLIHTSSNPNDSTITISLEPEIVKNKTEQYKFLYFKISKVKTPSTISLLPCILLLFVFAMFSLGGVVALVRTIPDLFLPTTLEAVKRQAIMLKDYSNGSWKGYFHVIGVLSAIYIWKQTFSVPGAIFLLELCKYAGKPLMDQYFSEKLNYLRRQIDENRDNLFFYLLFIRMFPLSPWWILNLSSPLLLIPIDSFFTSMFFGSIPYNLACSQAGNLLSELQSTTDIWRPTLLLKMFFISLLSLIPPL
ncbi:5613_t:CDS:2, partial [Acaulospora morrowiae]